jgi:glycosyltransferase involved in cell wall biosynthesis
MVRNEERALPRLLRSVAGIVDGVVLTDTGSTDTTVYIAAHTCRELGLPIDVFHDVWSDFGTNRTRNLQNGVDVAGGNPDTHLLLLDADMEVPAGTARPQALPEVGMLAQRHGASVWWNVRTIRADVSAKYVGRTHEYLAHDRANTKISWFTITDHCDGGCRADKFERDERLLRLDLAEKNDTRSRYYLAQSLQSLGRKLEARELYLERAKTEDFPEEAWAARYWASHCATGADADMLALNAYFTRPKRIEPLVEVARRASDAGKHALAIGLSRMADGTRFPADETLYCDADAYRWGMAYVDMVSSFYVGDHDRGSRACEYLHLTPGSPHWWIALENARFYAEALPGARGSIPFTPPLGFVPMNPSLWPRDRGGWWGLIRTVNYRIDDQGRYLTADGAFFGPDTPIITRNFIVCYDADMKQIGQGVELITPPSPVEGARIRGFEDLRFVRVGVYSGELVTVGARLDANAAGIPELWEATWGYLTGELRSSRRLSEEGKIEKNWLPIPEGYLYSHNPITIVDADGAPTHRASCTINLSAFRGSAAPIDYAGGRLYVVHEVIQPGGGKRVYLHRFVYVPRNAAVGAGGVYVSPPFLMNGRPCIECCFSIAAVTDGILMACSHEDRDIYTITVPDTYFDGLCVRWTYGSCAPLPEASR